MSSSEYIQALRPATHAVPPCPLLTVATRYLARVPGTPVSLGFSVHPIWAMAQVCSILPRPKLDVCLSQRMANPMEALFLCTKAN